ncbi:MAG: hypothetical protein R3D57_02750 [Hyphomicrobiaceae bacterium]
MLNRLFGASLFAVAVGFLTFIVSAGDSATLRFVDVPFGFDQEAIEPTVMVLVVLSSAMALLMAMIGQSSLMHYRLPIRRRQRR